MQLSLKYSFISTFSLPTKIHIYANVSQTYFSCFVRTVCAPPVTQSLITGLMVGHSASCYLTFMTLF